MRFASVTEVTGADILRICGPFLIPGPGPQAPGLSFSGLYLVSIDPPESSGPASLTFVGARTPLRVRRHLDAALIVAEAGIDSIGAEGNPIASLPSATPIVRVRSVPEAMAAVLGALSDRFFRARPYAFGSGNRIAPTAVVEGCLEGDVTVGAGAYVGPGSFIGAGTRIGPNAVIEAHCHIGRNCVIQSGVVIGCAGFGFFAPTRGASPHGGGAQVGPQGGDPRNHQGEDGGEGHASAAMPHPAGVEIGDGCWIGANSVVAAGVLEPTRLGRHCKLDSHVQIAHNVRLGDGCLLASQSGIAGSTVAGRRLRMGGASSVDGHLRLGNDVSVAACSGVTKDVPDKTTVAGFPARPIAEWRRGLARGRNRPEEKGGL